MGKDSECRDVVVLGGGAAGLFCAAGAGKRGRSVVVLERNSQVGRKIAISGGGRCNFTNLYCGPENFLSDNPRFCHSALARFTPGDFIALVERHGIAHHEKKLGQLFCDGSARQITQMLLAECASAGVEIRCGCEISRVRRDSGFTVETNRGAFAAPSLVLAAGGLSVPQTGATDFAYRLARQLGLRVVPPRPALVPLTLGRQDLAAFQELSGISVDARVDLDGVSFRESLLVTHRGLSGPVILQASSYWKPGEKIRIDLLPGEDAREFLAAAERSELHLATLLARRMPKRFADTWCRLNVPSRAIKQYAPKELDLIARKLESWEILPSGTEGFAKAEVTAGGIDTAELSSKTMAAKRVPGLYCVGEAVDVTGHLGGHNFQWAWASAHAAGQYV